AATGSLCPGGASPPPPTRPGSRIEAAISMRVDVLALKMVTPPATRAAMPSTRMNTIRSCARTERPNHRASSARARHDAGVPAVALESGARMAFLPNLGGARVEEEHGECPRPAKF